MSGLSKFKKGQGKSELISEVKSRQFYSEQVKTSGHIKIEPVRSGQDRACQVRTCQAMIDKP